MKSDQIADRKLKLAVVASSFDTTANKMNEGGVALTPFKVPYQQTVKGFNTVGRALIAARPIIEAAIAEVNAMVPDDQPPVLEEPSPEGFRSTEKVVTADRAVWTFGNPAVGGKETLRNGVHVKNASDSGLEYGIKGGQLHLRASTNQWFLWSDGWTAEAKDPFAVIVVDPGPVIIVPDPNPITVGSLAGLPSPMSGAHLATIAALGDNEWANLGQAAADPNWGNNPGRSWGAKVVYVPKLGVALYSGQGPHGHVQANGYYDNIFALDFFGFRWICLAPGIRTYTFLDDVKSGRITLGPKNYLIYADTGEPVFAFGGHIYQGHCFDDDQDVYCTGGWPDGVGGDQHANAGLGNGWYPPARDYMLAVKGWPAAVNWPPFNYMARTGKTNRESGGGMFYWPGKGFWTYWDYKTWSPFGPPDAGGAQPPVGFPDFGACQDHKRTKIYMGRMPYTPQPGPGEGHLHIYDGVAHSKSQPAWRNPPNKGMVKVPATNYGVLHMDTVADKVVSIYGWASFQDPYDNWRDLRGITIWDPETEEAETIPLPDWMPLGTGIHGFYAPPPINAHILYLALDGRGDQGTFLAYRYRKQR